MVALYVAEPEAFPRYEARIVPPAGEGAAFVVELSPQPSEPFVVQLGKDAEPGDYRVILFGVAGEERQELATFRFRVREP
jgi:hypothetical protein